MKKFTTTVFAILAFVGTCPTSVFANAPENPVQGAVQRLYNFGAKGDGKTHRANFQDLSKSIKRGEEPASSTAVDMKDAFKTASENGFHPDMGMWTGFLKRKRSGVYTLVFSTNGGNKFPMYSLWINGKQIVDAETEITAVDVSLNAGFNEVCLIVEGTAKNHITLTIKKKDSLKEPKNIGPSDLWHEDEPDDEDDDDE